MTKIYCVGELLVDIIGKDKASLKSNKDFSKHPGGAPANVAVAASRMGAETGVIATVGDDEFGEFLIEKMREENIETGYMRKSEKFNTTLAFASLDQESKPHFSFYRGADEKISRKQLQIQPEKEDIVHVGSLPLTDRQTYTNIVKLVKRTEATISFDPNIREDLLTDEYLERLQKIALNTDIMILAEDELQYFDDIDLGDSLEQLIVTKGSEGAEMFGEKNLKVKPPEVDVVDTTGAGDAFAGAYLALNHLKPKERLKKSVYAASVSTESEGAMSSLPYLESLKNKSLVEIN